MVSDESGRTEHEAQRWIAAMRILHITYTGRSFAVRLQQSVGYLPCPVPTF
jgi:hypothetical protein